jgi:biopolymer transport protein ExbD
MARHVGRKFGKREIVEADLDLLPLMNLFIAIIPMLLLSAVFVQLSAIDLNLPPALERNEKGSDQKESLALAVTIRDDHYVVEGNQLRAQVISRREEGADERLGEVLTAVEREHPDNEDVMIISQEDTRYDEIIHVMDISRDAGMPVASLLGTRVR